MRILLEIESIIEKKYFYKPNPKVNVELLPEINVGKLFNNVEMVIQGNLDLAIQETNNRRRKIPEVFSLVSKEVEHMTSVLTDLTMLTNADVDKEKINCEKIDFRLSLIEEFGKLS